MHAGDDETVSLCCGSLVKKCNRVLVLVNDVRGLGPARDSTEWTVRLHTHVEKYDSQDFTC